MSKNNIALGFSLNSILNSKNKHIILGRITQNIKLCRKYKVKMIIGSFTSNPFEMRSYHDLASLFLKLGMTQKEVKDSLETNNKF
jgi:RNase P/RNase MRP subunit p30